MEEEQSTIYVVPTFVKPLKEVEGLPVEGTEIKPGKYHHFKGKYYNMLYVTAHSEALERYAVYRQLYGNEKVWMRPLAMFYGSILVDGVLTPHSTHIRKQGEKYHHRGKDLSVEAGYSALIAYNDCFRISLLLQ